MAISHTPQRELTQEQFETHVVEIEKIFNPNVASHYRGKTIYYIADDVFNQPFFVNTMFEDVCDMTLHDSFLWIDRSFDIDNLQIHGIKKPRKKEFRNILKVTPPHTLSYYRAILSRSDPWSDYSYSDTTQPVVQRKAWIQEQCQKTFSGQANALPYDDIMGNSIFFPVTNGAMSKLHPPVMLQSERNRFDTSYAIQKGISRIYEAAMSWGICYTWNNVDFIIPMEREYIINVLKNREKVNGRRPLLPRLVREYERNGKTVARHFSAAMPDKEEPYIMNGRKYKVWIGTESYDGYLAGSKKLIKYFKEHK